jgi:hypothetical protein
MCNIYTCESGCWWSTWLLSFIEKKLFTSVDIIHFTIYMMHPKTVTNATELGHPSVVDNYLLGWRTSHQRTWWLAIIVTNPTLVFWRHFLDTPCSCRNQVPVLQFPILLTSHHTIWLIPVPFLLLSVLMQQVGEDIIIYFWQWWYRYYSTSFRGCYKVIHHIYEILSTQTVSSTLNKS